MKRFIFIILWSLIWMTAVPQSFMQFIRCMEQLPLSSRQAKADSFLSLARVFPYTESDTVCHFIYKGPATNVSVAGDFTNWKPGKVVLQNIPGTDFWFGTKYFEADARLDYKIVVNDTLWITDPGNPLTCKSGFGVNSELQMPGYRIPPETVFDPAIPTGTIRDTLFQSSLLGNARQFKIYLPSGYPASGVEYPVILFHDGIEFLSLGGAGIILDNMIARKQILPVIAVFVAPVDRDAEYSGRKKDAYSNFLAQELMPFIDAEYVTSRDPGRRAEMGISNGGNIALYSGITHPECFSKIAAFSSNVIPEIGQKFAKSANLDLEIYLDMGTYDIDMLIPMVDNFARLLDRKGFSYKYYTWHEGHSWGNWKGHLGVALKQFFLY